MEVSREARYFCLVVHLHLYAQANNERTINYTKQTATGCMNRHVVERPTNIVQGSRNLS